MYIYIHIPFCSHICSYCDFPKMLYQEKFVQKYLKELAKEIDKRYQDEEVFSIYLGGGTPTSLSLEELKYLLELTKKFKRRSQIEFTIESNIESLTKEKIKLLKEYGVNRISLGVQSFQDKNLKILGRCHTRDMVENKIQEIKEEGFTNISIDYIYGVSDDLKEIEEDMNIFLELDIPHFSAYSLIIEKNTIFGIQKREYIDEEKEYMMYKFIQQTLEKNHYQHYEISNYAKEGYQSLHNLNYWNNGSYYGFGLGAVSYINHQRITNTLNFSKYLEGNYYQEIINEDEELRISNEFILGLRKIEGIDVDIFYEKYQKNILEIPQVKELIAEKKLILKDHHLFISDKYFYLSNEILIHFI